MVIMSEMVRCSCGAVFDLDIRLTVDRPYIDLLKIIQIVRSRMGVPENPASAIE